VPLFEDNTLRHTDTTIPLAEDGGRGMGMELICNNSVKSDRSTMIHLGLAMKELGIDHLLYNNKRVYKVVPLKSA